MNDDRRTGFTLVEVLVALAILAIVSTLAFRAISGGLSRFDRDADEERAVLVAQAEMARVGHDVAILDGETDGHADRRFSWHIAITRYGAPIGGVQGHRVAVEVGWNEERQVRRIRLETVRLGPAGGGK
jgi:prepilin-type N-terminal cleavage/methylation domain-containing protein